MSGAGNEDNRERVVQQPPPPGLDLSAFPTDPLPAGGWLFRAHSAGRGAWYFTSKGDGRFDLTSPRGTCYAADDVSAALRERLGPRFVAARRTTAEWAEDTSVTEIAAPLGRGANLEHPDVANYPITGELVAMDDYSVTQAWATAFDAAGYEAIHYRGRLSHTSGVACWALFDEEDVKPYATRSVMSGRDACAVAGITVMPAPPTNPSTLRTVTPPS